MPIYFQGIFGEEEKQFPQWRYHKYYEPRLVNNTEEADAAKAQGYHCVAEDAFTPTRFKNFGYDFQELNERQLQNYALNKFEIDLSNVTDKDKLIQVLNRLYLETAEHREDIVLLAQSIEMEYDQTVADIRKNVENASEVTTEVLYI